MKSPSAFGALRYVLGHSSQGFHYRPFGCPTDGPLLWPSRERASSSFRGDAPRRFRRVSAVGLCQRLSMATGAHQRSAVIRDSWGRGPNSASQTSFGRRYLGRCRPPPHLDARRKGQRVPARSEDSGGRGSERLGHEGAFFISAVIAGCLACCGLYSSMYFGWLLATPLTDAQLSRVKFDRNAWFVIFAAASVVSIQLALLAIESSRKPE